MSLTNFLSQVTGLCADSRRIQPQETFVGVVGNVDGNQFAMQAYQRGVRTFLLSHPVDVLPSDACVYILPELPDKLSEIAKNIYPDSQRPTLIGVTGTSGKTSCCYMIAQILNALSMPCAQLGTLGAQFRGLVQETGLTTPDLLTVYAHLDRFYKSGAQFVAMEASSHALAQHRLEGLRFHTAVFTNLTQDHLDYHGSIENYGETKRQLFQWPNLQHVILNKDDSFFDVLAASTHPDVMRISYGMHPDADVRATDIQGYRDCTEADVITPWGREKILIPYIGMAAVSNTLAVISTLLAHKVSLSRMIPMIAKLPTIPGRMSRFCFPDRPTVFVDYAHKPGALDAVLQALAGVTRYHKIWCVFGCGGDRDALKRPQMGAIADQWADHIILTDDNPRTEDPTKIIQQICEGIRCTQKVVICHDRAAAIRLAIEAAGPQDVVLIAGRGDETMQKFRDKTVPFSDLVFVEEVLRA